MTELQSDRQLKSWGKSVWMGGLLGGFLSLVPFVNLLNVFFLFWLALAGGVTVHILIKKNEQIKSSEAAVSGALSGLLGSTIFSLFVGWVLLNLTQEKIEQIMSRNRWFVSLWDQEFSDLLQSGRFKITMVVLLSIFIIFSIVAGSIGGIISKQMFTKKNLFPHDRKDPYGGNS